VKRLLPSPWLSAGLFGGWLLLARTPSWSTVIVGAIVAVAMPLLTQALRPAAGPLRRWSVLVRLIGRVSVDVVRSGADVASGVMRSSRRPPRGTFVVIPLELRQPQSLAALAMITTVIPGTVWCELAPDHSALRLHVFDLGDEAEFVRHFKERYEHSLQEIFE
jgi:multicomponent K+:H+ antiporter subunit E